MRFPKILVAGVIAIAVPLTASAATTFNPEGNTFSTLYDTPGETVDLGNLNLNDGPINVASQFLSSFASSGSDGASGTLRFGAFSNPFAPGAEGSLDVNIVGVGLGDVTGTFGGTPLAFSLVGGDLVAELTTSFASVSDIKDFQLMFSKAKAGDLIQVNVLPTAVPVPAAAWLFGSGLLGLIGIARKRAAA